MIVGADFVAPVISAVGTAIAVLAGLWFKHRVDMRKQDAEDKAADRVAKERESAAEALRLKEAHERDMARIRMEAQLRAINDKQQAIAERQVAMDQQLQTNTFKLEDIQRMAQNSKPADLSGGK